MKPLCCSFLHRTKRGSTRLQDCPKLWCELVCMVQIYKPVEQLDWTESPALYGFSCGFSQKNDIRWIGYAKLPLHTPLCFGIHLDSDPDKELSALIEDYIRVWRKSISVFARTVPLFFNCLKDNSDVCCFIVMKANQDQNVYCHWLGQIKLLYCFTQWHLKICKIRRYKYRICISHSILNVFLALYKTIQ